VVNLSQIINRGHRRNGAGTGAGLLMVKQKGRSADLKNAKP